MRRHRNRNKGEILIDLTSLLDVIFIVLLVVISNQQNVTSEVKAQQAEMQAQQVEAQESIQQAEAQKQLYADQMDTVDNICLVSVNARYEQNNVTQRHISILKNGEDTEKEIDMLGNNTAEPLDELKTYLTEYIDSNSGKPIILSLNENDEDILYRDEKAIQKIFIELKDYSDDVYIK